MVRGSDTSDTECAGDDPLNGESDLCVLEMIHLMGRVTCVCWPGTSSARLAGGAGRCSGAAGGPAGRGRGGAGGLSRDARGGCGTCENEGL